MRLTGVLRPAGVLQGRLQSGNAVHGMSGVIWHTDTTPYYDGSYEVDPTNEPQVFHTHGLKMRSDFVVGPIPQNYGLITWNGSVLTVS